MHRHEPRTAAALAPLVTLALIAVPARAQLDDHQQACVDTLLAGLLKLDRGAASGATRCLRRYVDGKPLGPRTSTFATLEECVVGDPFGRLLRMRDGDGTCGELEQVETTPGQSVRCTQLLRASQAWQDACE